MNYNTLCLKLSSCLHSSTLTSLSCRSLYLSVCLSLSLCLPAALSFLPGRSSLPASLSLSVVHFPPPLPSLLTSLYSDSIYFDIYLSFSFPFFCSFFAATPPLIYSLCACFASHPPSPLPSLLHLISDTLTWLSPLLPREAWRATVSFNPGQCHLQTLTVAQRLRRRLAIKAAAAIKGRTGRNHKPPRGRLNPSV